MTDTSISVKGIAPISHKEGMALAETEYRRYTDMLGQLRTGLPPVQLTLGLNIMPPDQH